MRVGGADLKTELIDNLTPAVLSSSKRTPVGLFRTVLKNRSFLLLWLAQRGLRPSCCYSRQPFWDSAGRRHAIAIAHYRTPIVCLTYSCFATPSKIERK